LDNSYCELFVAGFQERFDLINTSFHPLLHITLHDTWLNSKLQKQISDISNVLSKLPALVAEIKNRKELSSFLLRSIESCIKVLNMKMFKDPAAVLINDIRAMNEMTKVREEYEAIKFQMKRMPTVFEPTPAIRRMKDLILAFNECQIDLESALEPIFQMCLLIKNKGKKVIKEDTKDDIRDLLTYVNLLLKPDFFSLLPEIYNKDDLVYAIMHLQSHKSLFYELLRQEPYRSGLSTITPVKEDDLKSLLHKWQDLFTEIETFKASPDFSACFSQFLHHPSLALSDLKLYSDRLRDLQRAALHYSQTHCRFKRLRYKVFKFCLEEFGERVEVLWPGAIS
jgi:hypothetical protein